MIESVDNHLGKCSWENARSKLNCKLRIHVQSLDNNILNLFFSKLSTTFPVSTLLLQNQTYCRVPGSSMSRRSRRDTPSRPCPSCTWGCRWSCRWARSCRRGASWPSRRLWRWWGRSRRCGLCSTRTGCSGRCRGWSWGEIQAKGQDRALILS